MPLKKTAKTTTTTTNKGAQATGQANPCTIELPPSPTPESLGLQADSDDALLTDLATTINLLLRKIDTLGIE